MTLLNFQHDWPIRDNPPPPPPAFDKSVINFLSACIDRYQELMFSLLFSCIKVYFQYN